MSNMALIDSVQFTTGAQVRSRALLIGESGARHLRRQLAESGYETAHATASTFVQAITDFVPDVALIVLEKEVASEGEAVAIARRLREKPATHSLPLVLVYVEEERLMRNAALNVGVDDCFGIWTPHGQILARLDALFWRIEVSRRAASMSGDRRLEIDNFMVLLDVVREDIRDSTRGSLALIYAMASSDATDGFDKAARDRTLAEAHGFFKLNLRRVDAVGFYGPTTLLIYLPRLDSREATAILMALRIQFLADRANDDLAIGVASFPDESSSVESLIEWAEAAAGKARAIAAMNRGNANRDLMEPGIPAQQSVSTFADQSAVAIAPSLTQRSASLASHKSLASSESPVVRESQSDRPEGSASNAPVRYSGSSVDDLEIAHAAAEHAAARERERRSRGAIIPRRLLLTVSDAARMAQLNALVRSAGYEARTAFDGQQALDLLRIESPDVLLLDYELRGIDGLEMLRRLCKQTNGKLTLPVVLLLPPMQVSARREALELGARGIVAMPYDPAELLDSVRLAGNSD